MKKNILTAYTLVCLGFIAALHTFAQDDKTEAPPSNTKSISTTAKLDVSAPDGIRPGGTLAQDLAAPKIPKQRITTGPAHRNYPEQPPMVPHNIRDYQIDKNFNMCLSCHSRSASPLTGATAVSITHYYDRDGQALAAISPRRYFCVQCHLPQADVNPARTNDYKSIDAMLQQQPAAE
ncbi:MAG TPA: nitrate reductase cytochrome c-type subunit [Cellvibrio sp.]|nr:nitrate reductase cytochrome c-type subunit [Cellvibrio sp.]